MAYAWWENAISLHHHTAGFAFLQVSLLTSYFAFSSKLRRHVELENLAAPFLFSDCTNKHKPQSPLQAAGLVDIISSRFNSIVSCKSGFQKNEEPLGEI